MPNRTKPAHAAKVEVAAGELIIGGRKIAPGTRTTIDLPVARLYTHAPLDMPVHVIHGTEPGPRIFVCAALHGDEINGVEIIRRLYKLPVLKRLKGVLIAVPVVNVFGFVNRNRYLPDRRDLNRSFPGSEKGSLAARLANLFLEEIVSKCTHGIDIHTAAIHRENLPQIRANLDDPHTDDLARAFGVPVLINGERVEGSLRDTTTQLGLSTLLYEAGEALRFDEVCIRAGVSGVVNVLRKLGMLPASRRKDTHGEPAVAHSTQWMRASQSGILRMSTPLGALVREGDALGIIADPFGKREVQVTASSDGIVIGRVTLPLVNEGDALYHIARFAIPHATEAALEKFQADLNEQLHLHEEPPIV